MTRLTRFVRRTRLETPADELFAWHARPGAFQRLTPPWEPVELVDPGQGIRNGSRAILRVGTWPFKFTWEAEHRDCEPGRQFRDLQVRGPFAAWDHLHRFVPQPDGGSILEDSIECRPPLGPLGRFVVGPIVLRKLDRMFTYRHRVTREDLAAHSAARGVETMKVAISGSSGLVGSVLAPFLTTGGHEIVRLVRSRDAAGESVFWDAKSGEVDTAGLEGVDAVVHLAGESIAEGRWSDAKKARIRDSRVDGTRAIAEALARMANPPRVLVCASAIGYYGDRGDEVLTEESASGTGFLPGVCREWEAATKPAADKGIRVVNLRFGIILSPKGGALAKMLTPFKLGAGGVVGNGKQYYSWVSVDDVAGIIHHALTNESVRGPVNVVAPGAVTNREFTKTLGTVLSRPTIFPMPAFAARLAFGEMADALLLASARVKPAALERSGYAFRHMNLEDALRHLLGR